VIKKEIEGTALSQVSDMQIIQEMSVVVERRCILSVQIFFAMNNFYLGKHV